MNKNDIRLLTCNNLYLFIKRTFRRSQWRINKKLVDNSVTGNMTKWKNMPLRSTGKCICLKKLFGGGLKINKPLSSLLVYWRIMPLAKRLPSKFHSCTQSCSLLGQSFSLGHYPPLLFNFHTLYEFRFSDWLICTTWPWVMTQQPPWRHRGVIAMV